MKLQRFQNMAGRVIFELGRFDHITLAFMDLHWLKIKERINYKIATLVYKCQHGMSTPSYSYLQDILPDRSHSRSMKSVTANKLTIYSSKHASAKCRFQLCRFADMERSASICYGSRNFEEFKKRLKTHLFTLSYDV